MLACMLAACSAAPHAVGSEPSWRRSSPAPAATAADPAPLAPAGEPAQSYNEPTQPPPHTPLGDAVIAAIADAAQRAHVAPPVPDAQLFRACAELAGIVPQTGLIDYDRELWILQRSGMIEPTPPFYSSWSKAASVDSIVDGLRPAIADIVRGHARRFGVGLARRGADGTVAVAFVADDSPLVTAPIPRATAAHDVIAIDGSVVTGYRDLALWLKRSDGTIDHHAVAISDRGAFKTTVACGDAEGRQQIEIEAVGPVGPTTLANFPVWCGEQPPQAPPAASEPPDPPALSERDAERQLLALINRDRRAAGLAAMAWDDHLADVARAHSQEMEQTGVVAHNSPKTGTSADRIRAAGIESAVQLENVGRGYAVRSVHEGFMNSPSHRANVLNPSATTAGIGVVYADSDSGRVLYVTEDFIRVTPRIDPGQVAATVVQRIGALRPVSDDARLHRIAQGYAEGLAAGKTRDELAGAMGAQLDPLGHEFARIAIAMVVKSDVAEIDGKELLGSYQPSAVGVGVAQGHHPELGDNAIWVVVLMAEPRAK